MSLASIAQKNGTGELRSQYAVLPAAARLALDVVPGRRPQLPPGPWQRSAALDAALSRQGFLCQAFLRGDRLVLTALGE
jgi:hypothetical protein